MIAEIISFDLCGKFAHFRKFYASSSALSYTIPPKTTILGIIASILGLERDSYYESLDELLISVSIESDIRKIFQKFNYLNVKDNINFDISKEENNVNGISNRTQVSMELIIPENIRENVIRYRIFVANNGNNTFFEQLKLFLSRNNSIYGISLGPANLIGYIDNYVDEYKIQAINDKSIRIKTIVDERKIKLNSEQNSAIIEQDIFPVKMKFIKSKNTRIAIENKSLIYPTNNKPMVINILDNINFYKIQSKDKNETNLFLI